MPAAAARGLRTCCCCYTQKAARACGRMPCHASASRAHPGALRPCPPFLPAPPWRPSPLTAQADLIGQAKETGKDRKLRRLLHQQWVEQQDEKELQQVRGRTAWAGGVGTGTTSAGWGLGVWLTSLCPFLPPSCSIITCHCCR